jgi:hypothetical protein
MFRRVGAQSVNVEAYKDAWARFWGSVTALEQIVVEAFPDGDAAGIEPTRFQVDALRDLGNRVGALVEGWAPGEG